LPLTGGALGKLAVKPIIGDGAASLAFAVAAIGSTLLMLHFIRLRQGTRHGLDMAKGNLMNGAWFAAAISAMVLPWVLFAPVTGQHLSSAASLYAVAELAWPVALGAALWWGICDQVSSFRMSPRAMSGSRHSSVFRDACLPARMRLPALSSARVTGLSRQLAWFSSLRCWPLS
jgi:hypothetical protein